MPLDANIILAGRPAPIENPMQVEEQAAQLAGMRQQQAQSAGLYPSQQTTAAAQAQAAQLQAQQLQIQVDQQKRLSQAWAETMSPSGASATPAPTAPAPPPAPSSAQSALTGPPPDLSPDQSMLTSGLTPNTAPPAGPPAIAALPASAAGAGPYLQGVQPALAAPPPSAAAPAVAPQPAPSIGPATDKLASFYNRALQLGVLPQTLQPIQKAFLDTQQGYAKLGTDQLDYQIKKNSLINGDLMGAFSDLKTGKWVDPTKEQWAAWVQNAAAKDHLTDQDIAAIKQRHPDNSPPTGAELQVYSHTLYTDALLKQSAKEDLDLQRGASQNVVEASKAEDAQRADAANQLMQAPSYGDFASRRASIVAQNPRMDQFLPNFTGKDPAAPLTQADRMTINQSAVTPEQRSQLAQQQAALQQRIAFQNSTLDLRGAIADQNAAIRESVLALRGQGKGSNLTPAQIATQEGQITRTETGLNAARMEYGASLKAGKDAKGVSLYDSSGNLTPAGAQVKARFDAASDALQKQQFRRANIYHIGTPDLGDVQAAQDGEQITADDGSVWTKKGGVAFHTGAANAPQAAATPAAAPAAPRTPPAAPPATPPKPAATPANQPAQKMTEAQARAKAIAAGRDPDWYVNALRQRNMLQ